MGTPDDAEVAGTAQLGVNHGPVILFISSVAPVVHAYLALGKADALIAVNNKLQACPTCGLNSCWHSSISTR